MRLTVSVCALVLIGSGTMAAAISGADKCEADKNKTAGKYAFCRLMTEAKAIKTGTAPDYSKCDSQFGQKWMKAETKGGGMCPSNGDQAAIQACITAHTDDIAATLNGGTCVTVMVSGLPRTGQTQCDQGAETLGACPGSPAGQDGALQKGLARTYTDNGDGTITDKATGLMWEKLSDDGSIHDWDDSYPWKTAFTTKIAMLNGGGGFAGHTDWRLPNRFEVESLVDAGRVNPSINPAFNADCAPNCTVTTCSCMKTDIYYSSTTSHFAAGRAWIVAFSAGDVGVGDKLNSRFVRAVRGGS